MKYKKIFLSASSLFQFFAVRYVLAQSGGGSGVSASFDDPLRNITIQQFIEKILDIFITIGTPVAVLFIIYAGFLFVTARGNEQQLTKAKGILFYTLIGTAILLGSWVLATAIGNTICDIRGGC